MTKTLDEFADDFFSRQGYGAAPAPARGGDFDKESEGIIRRLMEEEARVAPVATAARTAAGAAAQPAKAEPSLIAQVGRQILLTARYALEGPAQAAQIVTEPIRLLVNDPLLRATGLLKGSSQPLGEVAASLADWAGLPKPQTGAERTVAEAARLVAGSAVGLGAAHALQRAGVQGIGALTAAPGAQLSSAAGAGLAGGSAREYDAGPWAQAGAAMLGGIAGGMAPGAAIALKNKALAAIPAPVEGIDLQLGNALRLAGGEEFSSLPERTRKLMRQEANAAFRTGREMSPDAVRRLADFSALGQRPTRGMITQDPVDITREQNLMKMAANSADPVLNEMPRRVQGVLRAVVDETNDLGARNAVDPLAAGRTVTAAIGSRRDALRDAERGAWNEARNSPGYTQPIYPDAISNINRALGEESMMPFMDKNISNFMESFISHNRPFTPRDYRNLQSMLSKAMTSTDGNARHAAGIARRALEETPMRPITNPGGRDYGQAPVTEAVAAQLRRQDVWPQEAIDAVNRARAATRAAYEFEDSSPLVRTALGDGRSADPQRIGQQYVIGGTPDEAAAMRRLLNDQEAGTIKDALLTHIKDKSLSGKEEEMMNFTSAGMNRAIRGIGEEKLATFLSPEEMARLQRASRVGQYVQNQPSTAAVNNSNSGALVLGRWADAATNLLKGVPLLNSGIAKPLEHINANLTVRRAARPGLGLLREDVVPRITPDSLPEGALEGLLRRRGARYTLPMGALSGAGLSPIAE